MCKSFIYSILFIFICGAPVSLSGQKRVAKVWQATVFTTAEGKAQKMSQTASLVFQKANQPLEKDVWVFVDPSKTYQTLIGIGGAITDASAEVFAKLPADRQNEIVTNFFDEHRGIGYSFVRTNIGSCDFSSDTYSYVADNDQSLTTFSVAHDEKYRIPLIKRAIAAAGGQLPLFISPWSPPAWMKDNNSLVHGGKLLPRFAQAWANYYVKFIKTYQSKGIPVWGMSVQNEPMAVQTWESCVYTADEERDFIKHYLGPTLVKSGLKSKKLIAWDHNRDLIYHRASVIMDDPDAAKYVWGFGYHWYETWVGGGMQHENLKRVREAYPSKHFFFSEGCIEKFDTSKINDWWLGERYGRAMITDFNNGAEGWIDWNILLDQQGGPNHVRNFCYAPVHADLSNGNLTYTSIFYYLGHFSKFIRPEAKRIACSTTREQLLATAFVNKNGKIALIVMNPGEDKMNANILIEGVTSAVECLPHSISTIVFE
jgi:O-Glycosyl hydrolase